MTDSIYLSRADVERLTGKVRFSAQRRALDALRVAYDVSLTGEPLVRRDRKHGRLWCASPLRLRLKSSART